VYSLVAGFLLNGRLLAVLAAVAALLAGVWGYGWRQERAGAARGRAEVRADWDGAKARQRAVDAAERDRREASLQEIARHAQDQTRRARADAAGAARAADSLRGAFAAAVERRCDPAATAGGAPAASAGALPADVLGGLADAARELASAADERGTAGAACVRSFDTLTAGGAILAP
jgi:hypothetical protein